MEIIGILALALILLFLSFFGMMFNKKIKSNFDNSMFDKLGLWLSARFSNYLLYVSIAILLIVLFAVSPLKNIVTASILVISVLTLLCLAFIELFINRNNILVLEILINKINRT